MDKPPIAFPGKDDARRIGGRVRDLLCVYILLGVSALHSQRLANYGIGVVGSGATPQISGAQGGRGGGGIRNSLPWVDAKPPVLNVPVKVLMLG